MNFTLITKLYGQKVQRVETRSKRRFYNHIRTIKWKDVVSCHLRVSYETGYDVFGKKQTFHNNGIYDNEKDFLLAFAAFTEV